MCCNKLSSPVSTGSWQRVCLGLASSGSAHFWCETFSCRSSVHPSLFSGGTVPFPLFNKVTVSLLVSQNKLGIHLWPQYLQQQTHCRERKWPWFFVFAQFHRVTISLSVLPDEFAIHHWPQYLQNWTHCIGGQQHGKTVFCITFSCVPRAVDLFPEVAWHELVILLVK